MSRFCLSTLFACSFTLSFDAKFVIHFFFFFFFSSYDSFSLELLIYLFIFLLLLLAVTLSWLVWVLTIVAQQLFYQMLIFHPMTKSHEWWWWWRWWLVRDTALKFTHFANANRLIGTQMQIDCRESENTLITPLIHH